MSLLFQGLLIFKEKNGTSNCYVAPYNITDLPDSPLLEDILDTVGIIF